MGHQSLVCCRSKVRFHAGLGCLHWTCAWTHATWTRPPCHEEGSPPLFFDNYFLSIKLVQDLEEKGTYMTSTIHSNCKGWPKDFSSAMMKKMKVGDVHFWQDGNLVATVWKDKRTVTVVSTNTQLEMGTQDRRAPGGKKHNFPKPIILYNHSMNQLTIPWLQCCSTFFLLHGLTESPQVFFEVAHHVAELDWDFQEWGTSPKDYLMVVDLCFDSKQIFFWGVLAHHPGNILCTLWVK